MSAFQSPVTADTVSAGLSPHTSPESSPLDWSEGASVTGPGREQSSRSIAAINRWKTSPLSRAVSSERANDGVGRRTAFSTLLTCDPLLNVSDPNWCWDNPRNVRQWRSSAPKKWMAERYGSSGRGACAMAYLPEAKLLTGQSLAPSTLPAIDRPRCCDRGAGHADTRGVRMAVAEAREQRRAN